MYSDPTKLWEATLGQLQVKLARPIFDTFLCDTKAISLTGDLLTIEVPNSFTADYLEKRIDTLIQSVLKQISGKQLKIRFEQGLGPHTIPSRKLPATSPVAGTHLSPRQPLHSRNTFESFVVGLGNKLAYNVAFAAAHNSAPRYNPVFLYSEPGLGKTHILRSMEKAAELSGQNVRYVSSERFTNEFVSSIKLGKVGLFREGYQALDLLLIDDFQLLSGKEQTQEVFFHIFNDLHQNNSQIVVAADRPTRAMTFLTNRLHSRLDWGISIRIVPPNAETRLQILQTKAKAAKVSIPDAVLIIIAQNSYQSVRELEGTLNRVIAYSEATGLEYSPDLLPVALSDLSDIEDRDPAPTSLVLKMIASDYGIPVSSLESPQRDRLTSEARHVAMYLLRTKARKSTGEIGRLLGGRDHSTVNSGCTRVEKQLVTDPSFNRRFLILSTRIEALP